MDTDKDEAIAKPLSGCFRVSFSYLCASVFICGGTILLCVLCVSAVNPILCGESGFI
jgi:hypothetical protein